MKLTIDRTKILGVIDDRDGKYPRVTILLDDGKSKDGRQNALGVELSGKSLDELRGLPEQGDSFEGDCFIGSRESNGRVFTSVRAWKFKLIPGRKQPNQRDQAPIDDTPF